MCLEMSRFKDAIATGEIELIVKTLAADLSLETIEHISVSIFGERCTHVVHLKNELMEDGSDRCFLGVNDTLLFFEQGILSWQSSKPTESLIRWHCLTFVL